MSINEKPIFILASASPRRLELLTQINATPDKIITANIDETQLKGELPKQYALRMAKEKSNAVINKLGNNSNYIILAADTIVVVGTRILTKAKTIEEATKNLTLISGRRHRVYTAISIIVPNLNDSKESYHHQKLVQSIVSFKRFDNNEIEKYLSTNEWRDKAGSYAVQGQAASFIKFISGSYSNIVGLPLFETAQLLKKYKIL